MKAKHYGDHDDDDDDFKESKTAFGLIRLRMRMREQGRRQEMSLFFMLLKDSCRIGYIGPWLMIISIA